MNTFKLDLPALTIGDTILSRGDMLLIGFAILCLLALLMLFSLWRTSRHRQLQDYWQRQQDTERLAELAAAQNELAGRLAAMHDNSTVAQSELARQLDERLVGVTGQVAQSLTQTTKTTQESLAKLQERLAVIDTAQNNIQNLAQDVVGLQAILQNKQTRGAFGQSRMETIVQDGLPMGAFNFQPTLSNGKRPDCTIIMPNDGPVLVIDAKFPLEAWSAIKAANHPGEAKQAAQQFRRDMEVHIKDISEKYFIPGETQDTAFLFVPSESIFAEVHENFEGTVQKAHKSRIVIVSPSLLLLSVQVIQSVLKDARMREQAHLIQAEVAKFVEDLGRLDTRVAKLKSHFALANKDIDDIVVSTGKLSRHGAKIESLEFSEPPQPAERVVKPGKPFLRSIEGGDG